ncbi:MAG: sulfite exporter TauE/SafE family protein [Longimicrobiales bacterium]
MTLLALVTLFGVGIAVGVVSGLLGIGGGVLIVPFLYFFYEHGSWSGTALAPALHAAVAHATSLFIILPTAIRGTLTYNHAGLVAWQAALPIGAASVVAAIAGASAATVVAPEVLKLSFGIVLLVSGLRMLRGRAHDAATHPERLTLSRTIPTGLAVGAFSALMGVGGGIVAIPLLVHVVGIELRKVAATSLAIMVLAAAAGVITYAVQGMGEPGLPSFSLGYIHFLAALPILATSLLAVGAGVALNRQMATPALRVLFGLVFVLLGLRLIWQNLMLVL